MSWGFCSFTPGVNKSSVTVHPSPLNFALWHLIFAVLSMNLFYVTHLSLTILKSSWNGSYILGMAPIFCTPGFTEVLQVNLGYYLKFDHAHLNILLYIYPTIECHTAWQSDSSSQLPYEQELHCNMGIPHDPTYLLSHSCVAVRPYITFAMYFRILNLW